jgi:hypothetical protein
MKTTKTPTTTGDRIRLTLQRQQVMQDRVQTMQRVSHQLTTLSAALLALNPDTVTADTLEHLATGAATVADAMKQIAARARQEER